MVKTDGGSNMTVNSFQLTLPGWQEDEEIDQQLVTRPTTPAVPPPPAIVEDDSAEIEIEFSVADNDPVWEILGANGVSLSTKDEE